MNISIEVKRKDLCFYIALFVLIFYATTQNCVLPFPEFQRFQRPLLLGAGVLVLPQIIFLCNRVGRKEYIWIYLSSVLFIGALMVSAISNSTRYRGYKPYAATLNLVLFLTELIVVMTYAAENGLVKKTFKCFFLCAVILLIITDLLVIAGISFKQGMTNYYLVGSKFSVAYLQIYCTSFWLLSKDDPLVYIKKHKLLMVILIIFLSSISFRIDCNTGMIGTILLLIFIWGFSSCKKTFFDVFLTPAVFVLILMGATLIAFEFERVVQQPMITYIVEDVLNRETDMTGRTDIYSSFVPLMTGNWMYGYGYGAAYRTSMKLFGYADTQNALLEWILQIGLVGATFLVMVLSNCFYKLPYKNRTKEIVPLISLVYVFVFLGTVEITYNMNFLLWMFMLFAYSHEKKEEDMIS